jgi:hypothetical protein
MVLVIVSWGDWTASTMAKGKPRGITEVEFTQIRWYSDIVRQGGWSA